MGIRKILIELKLLTVEEGLPEQVVEMVEMAFHTAMAAAAARLLSLRQQAPAAMARFLVAVAVAVGPA